MTGETMVEVLSLGEHKVESPPITFDSHLYFSRKLDLTLFSPILYPPSFLISPYLIDSCDGVTDVHLVSILPFRPFKYVNDFCFSFDFPFMGLIDF